MAQAEEMCLENLDEFINDENRLVTYKWLSRSLSINVNQAKQLLHKFVTQQRKQKKTRNLSVTYFLAGLCQENDSLVYKIEIVPEEALQSSKSDFSQLTSCHVYSVQKGKLKDSNSLYTADYDLVKENILDSNKFSVITCPAAKLRAAEEVEKNLYNKTPSKSPVKQNKVTTSVSETVSKNKASKKPDGIAGLFARSAKKQADVKVKEEQKPATTSERDASTKSKSKPKSSGMMNFFSKHDAKPKSKMVPEPSTLEKEKEEDEQRSQKDEKENEQRSQKDEKENEQGSRKDKKENEQRNQTDEKENEQRSQKDKKKSVSIDGNKRKKIKVESNDEEPVQDKKRRRVRQIVSDTSSDEEEMEIEEPIPSPLPLVDSDPEEIPPTPSPEDKIPESGTTSSNTTHGKLHKRKLVSKTYLNDDGYIVTEKVYEDEWEDVAEDEGETTAKTKEEKPAAKSKKSSPVSSKSLPATRTAAKQMSLTNFFKKK